MERRRQPARRPGRSTARDHWRSRKLDHVEQLAARRAAAVVQAPHGDLEVLAAPGEGGQVEEAHHLLDLGLDVGVQGRQRLVGVVHGMRPLYYVPGSGGCGSVTRLLRLRR